MGNSDSHKIRPAGRHLLTIGRDLIQDSYAAVVELIKNAYDADSNEAEVSFEAQDDGKRCKITISDHGHGMSRETVIDKWMVPSTRDKLDRKFSPSGRIMQGRKGVGRYAASVLGSDLLLETVTDSGEKTSVYVEWESFEKAKYLDDIEVLVESKNTKEDSGTTLIISGDSKYLEEWNKKQFDKLRFELKKLIPPTTSPTDNSSSELDFKIKLSITGFKNVPDCSEYIEPYPIFELFDYRIKGTVRSNGKGELVYTLQKARNTIDQPIKFDLGAPTGCGNLVFDIRVYDRDADSVESLISRGLKDEQGNYVGKNQARQLLNQSNGIGVYRNGFRIRPLGDADFDWLRLNQERVQNPSMRIGSNQAIGYVLIESEESSNLIEKSARDGLRENNAYERLKEITKKVISELEGLRFSYRRKEGLSTPALKVEKELERLFSFDELKKEIEKRLNLEGVARNTADEVINLIVQEEEDKNKAAENIRKAVATYQGQASLGKIINVVLHEGRRSLNYFKNEVPRIGRFRKKLNETGERKHIDEIIKIAQGVEVNSNFLSDLFKRLDPLATGRRLAPKSLSLKSEIQSSLAIFRQEFEDNNISAVINGSIDPVFIGWTQDIHAIFTNLIDNSIFWMKEKSSSEKRIIIDIKCEDESLAYIDFRDTGPGIEPSLIIDDVIFEPQFSTKPSGTGIGLAIAGEAAERNGLELKALESESGAYFRLQVKDSGDE